MKRAPTCSSPVAGQDESDKAVAEMGKNITGVKTDISKLDDLNRLYEIVAKKGKIDVIFAGAGFVEKAMTPAVTPQSISTRASTPMPAALILPSKRRCLLE